MTTTLSQVRLDLFDTLDSLRVANTYRWRLADYQTPAYIVGWPQTMDVRPAMGDIRDFVIDVFVAVDLTDDPSCDDLLSDLLDQAVEALLLTAEWDVQPVTDFGVEQATDGRSVLTCRLPVAVLAWKVLVVHPGVDFSVSDVHRGLVKGLKANGCDVAELNLSDRLEFYARAEIKGGDDVYVKAFSDDAAVAMAAKGIEAALYEWWPDVVVIVSGFFVPPALWGLLSKRPHHVVYWATESPYEDDRQGRGARFADTVILNDPVNLDQYRADINARTFYLPHSYDPDIHHPGGDPVHDFVFVGTGFPSRIEWLEAVDWAGVDAVLAGNWNLLDDGSPLTPLVLHQPGWCIDNADTADLYRGRRRRR